MGKSPSTKRCVGSPPRQTEDPLSPPCVAHFSGDNGGSTAAGVTRDEVRLLVYFQGSAPGTYTITDRGAEQDPDPNQIFDLSRPAADNEPFQVRSFRLWQRFFNERYQTYGRFVRFFVHYGSDVDGPEARRADASTGLKEVDPFAVLLMSQLNADAYLDVVSRHGVLSFLGRGTADPNPGLAAASFQKYAGLFWAYDPSVEKRAAVVTGALCRQLVGRPVSFSGNAQDQGTPRVLGMYRADDRRMPQLQRYAALVKSGVEACGGTWAAEATFPESKCIECGSSPEYAVKAVAGFREAGVTTVVWPGGFETRFSKAAAAAGWFPEIVLGGDGVSEDNLRATTNDQRVWAHTTAITAMLRSGDTSSRPCGQAAREADPETADAGVACESYETARQVFIGIQVAGPRLTSSAVDKGFHAIPAVASTDPSIPACFYEASDYTCVKDAMLTWWDPSGTNPASGQPGCNRMVDGGLRRLAGGWSDRDIAAGRTAGDPCNGG
ncbi:MAG TPA: hypothetical protein VMY88_03275 [Acidimicrobiales bacterium]|nr:hypothetical protein [Acidimicrobiales bacterium]